MNVGAAAGVIADTGISLNRKKISTGYEPPNGQKPETPEFLRLTMAGPRGAGGTSGPGPSGPRPELAAPGDNLAWLPSALQRTPRLCPPRPQRPLPPLGGQAMDRSWFSSTNVSKLLFFDLGQSRVLITVRT